jgi:hypothetical protein
MPGRRYASNRDSSEWKRNARDSGDMRMNRSQ